MKMQRVTLITDGSMTRLPLTSSTNKFTLYLPEKTTIDIESEEWIDDDNDIQPIFTIVQKNEEEQILNSIEKNEQYLYYENSQTFQEKFNIEYLLSRQMYLHCMENFGNSLIEIFPGTTLNINENLEELQRNQLVETLKKNIFFLCIGIYGHERN